MVAPLPHARLRRLPGSGMLRRRAEYEVELDGESGPVRSVTRSPYAALREVVGWDEAALLQRRATQVWDGGTGPWVSAFTGTVDPLARESGRARAPILGRARTAGAARAGNAPNSSSTVRQVWDSPSQPGDHKSVGREMTPSDRAACVNLLTIPGRGQRFSPRRFLKEIGARDGSAWAAAQVVDAVARRDEDHFEAALIVAAVFGGVESARPSLLQALNEDWHHSYEDILAIVEKFAESAGDLPALVEVTSWVPTSLQFDEERALARRAMHDIAKIAGADAEAALVRLTGHEDDTLARLAVRLLDRRSCPSPDGDQS